MNKSDLNLMIATPVYGGNLTLNYHISLIETVIAFELGNIPLETKYISDSSLVMDARNRLVKMFLEDESNFTHLLFIDADISWNIQDIRDLIEYSDNDQYQIVCGLYGKKKLNYDLMSHVTKQGCPPEQLHNFTATVDKSLYVPKIITDNTIKLPVEVDHTGCGFMMINRKVFLKFQENYQQYNYYNLESNSNEFLYFDTNLVFNNGRKVHVGEDISFCLLCKELNINTYVLPWVNLGHTGNFTYECKY